MLKMGVPVGAVQCRMQADGAPQAEIDALTATDTLPSTRFEAFTVLKEAAPLPSLSLYPDEKADSRMRCVGCDGIAGSSFATNNLPVHQFSK